MKPRDRADRFAELFRALYHRFHRRDRVDGYRPTAESLAVLRHLHTAGPLTVVEASRHFDRSQSAMSELLDRLESRGVLERMKDERDRRRTLVWLTPGGLDALERSEQVLSMELLEHAFEQLDEAASVRVVEALRELLETQPRKPGFKDSGAGGD